MTSFGFHGRVCAVDIYSMLLHQNCGNWFECHTEVNVLSVADASLYSSGIITFCFYSSIIIIKYIILLAITEAYPDLKANENFKELQAQLEGTENRISVERKRFNDTARAYNTAIRTFPRNLLAGMFGFDKRPYFESEEGADKAPKVEF